MKKSNVIIILCIISIFSLGVVLVTLKKGDKRENSYKATTSQVKNENTKENKEKKLKRNPKYVFLFIGDGNAMPQINAAENYLSAKDGNGNKPNAYKIKENKLSFTRFPVMGMTTTYAADTFITDSASAGTAISTGNKTDDGVISMGSDRKTSYKTIAEIVRESGKKVGIVSSVSIDHATPAVFYAHNKTRKNYYEIAMNMPRSDFNYFAGGGLKEPIGKNKDKPHVHEEAKKLGYKIVKTKEDFNKLSNKEEKIIAESPVLDKEQALPYEVDNSKDGITLKEFTKKGIEVLNNEKGFFMMVEGGKIDWACHANDATTSIKDTIAFDESVKVAIEFYEKYPEDTLIVVTADHETGGLTQGFAGTGYDNYYDLLYNQKVSYDKFDNIVKNYSEEKKENAKFEEFMPNITKNFGLTTEGTDERLKLKDHELKQLKYAFHMSMKDEKSRKLNSQEKLLYGSYDPLTVTITHILNQKAGIGWTSYAHTGVPVPTFAKGQGEELFNGYYDNTDIFYKLKIALNLK